MEAEMSKGSAIFVLLLQFCGIAVLPANADEGMWPPSMVRELPMDTLRAMGLRLSADQIHNPVGGGVTDAVVRLGGGSGSFVSPNGLMVTNHHVAFTAIQRQSTPEHNYLQRGFYAATLKDELPAIGYNAYVTKSVEDVSGRVFAALSDDMTDLEREQAIERVSKEIVAEAEKPGDVDCRVSSFYGGKQYVLTTYLKIRDVRLVFAPPRAIGDYGGETDNWMWPRHAGDFAFMRAYVGPNGKPAEYAAENVPYKPKRYLKVSAAGVTTGDFAMVIGFPGHTTRYECASAIDYMVHEYYPKDIRTRQELIDILEALSAQDSAMAVRLSPKLKGLYNYLKKRQGILDGFARAHLLEHKIDAEQQLETFIHSTPELIARYGNVLPQLDSLYHDYAHWQERAFVVDWLGYRSDYVDAAHTIYKWALEKEKPDLEREPGYQDRDTVDNLEALKNLQINLVPEADKRILLHLLKMAAALPADQQLEALKPVLSGVVVKDRPAALSRFVDDLYAGTKIGTAAVRTAMFHETVGELEARHDPFLDFARALEKDHRALREREKAHKGALTRLEPKLIEAYFAWRDGRLYPDANGTMRFNYGTVRGYNPRDAVRYRYITSLSGVIEKDTGVPPFDAPQRLKAAYTARDFEPWVDTVINDVPVDFLSTNDITNGSSGSPVMNGAGELIGLAFDGNYEAMTSDYEFDPKITRCINVDIRYALFLLTKVYGAERVFNELTIR